MRKSIATPFDSRQLIVNLSRVIAIGLIGLLSGCASIGETFERSNRRMDDSGQYSGDCSTYHGKFYAGVKADSEEISDCIEGRGFLSEFGCLQVLDMPLSFVADTLFLPYIAIRNEIERDVYRNDRGEVCSRSSPIAPSAQPKEDWPLPPPAQVEREDIAPQRVFDIKASGLRGASQGYVLADGRILFWGDAEEITRRAISVIDPSNGRIETLWRSDEGVLGLKAFFLTPDRKASWFYTVDANKPERFYVLDIATRRVWPMEDIYGQGVPLVLAALKDDHYWNARMESDGRLLLEWESWYSIANWWGKTPADQHMQDGDDGKGGADKDVYSRAYLPSPVEWLKQGGKTPRLPIAFDASFQNQLDKRGDERPKPGIGADGRYYAPINDGVSYSTLSALPLPGYGLTVQLFNRYRAPGTMKPCGVGNDDGKGVWSSASSETCARFQGAYVEQTADGKLVHILNHGVGVPEGAVARGRLFAMSGITEGSQPARYVSLWDAPAGKLLARFALPKEAVEDAYPYTLLFSNDSKELYCITSYPHPKLYVWSLEKAWRELAGTRAQALHQRAAGSRFVGDCLCAGYHDHRPVSVGVPLGSVPYRQGGDQVEYFARHALHHSPATLRRVRIKDAEGKTPVFLTSDTRQPASANHRRPVQIPLADRVVLQYRFKYKGSQEQ